LANLRSKPEIPSQNLVKSQKDKAFYPQMAVPAHPCAHSISASLHVNAKKRDYFYAPAVHCTLYKAFAFICGCWRSFADDMLLAFK